MADTHGTRGRAPGAGGRPQRRHQSTQMMPLPGAAPRRPAPPPPTRAMPMNQQPPHQPPPKRRSAAGARPKGRKRKRRITPLRVLTVLALAFVVFLAGIWIYLDTSINRVEALADYEGRPAAAAGTNWLIVGSDSREGMSEDDQRRLKTGRDGGQRLADTVMIAHLPDNSTTPTLVSIPRDSQVPIPGRGVGRINSAYSGGPQVLVQTVEQATGLRMDHYAEIGFGGFATIVDAIGGVTIDIENEMYDTHNDITIPQGRQKLDGRESLHFVRMRYSASTPRSDLDRVANQRKFLGALASEMASPATLLNPFDLFPLLGAVPEALSIDEGDRLHHVARLGWNMRGISGDGMLTTTVPVTSAAATTWDPDKSQRLFDALRNDDPVPDDVVMK